MKIDVLDDNKRHTTSTDHEITSGNIWNTKENTIRNLYLQFDDCRHETNMDMFVQTPPKSHCTSNFKQKFDPSQVH